MCIRRHRAGVAQDLAVDTGLQVHRIAQIRCTVVDFGCRETERFRLDHAVNDGDGCQCVITCIRTTEGATQNSDFIGIPHIFAVVGRCAVRSTHHIARKQGAQIRFDHHICHIGAIINFPDGLEHIVQQEWGNGALTYQGQTLCGQITIDPGSNGIGGLKEGIGQCNCVYTDIDAAKSRPITSRVGHRFEIG